ncbi:MAG: twin-arginine translocase subunit TatC [Saprospiraceae bacterium]|nr:twin-arginine translocase subunit TatC [Saprospiraceae bacterium]
MPLDQVDVDKIGEPQSEMSFLDHLEELRWHIIRSLLVVVCAGIILFLFYKSIFEHVIFGPANPEFITYRIICNLSDAMCFTPPDIPAQAIGFGESFIMSIKTSFVIGLIVSFPYVFWEFWRFISPGLYKKERKATRGIVFICSMLFLTGVLFGYFIIAPFAVNFLMGFTIPGVQNTPTLSSYLNYMIMFTAPAGMIFELPIVVYFLSKVGLVTPEFMRQYRRHSIIAILLVAAIVTPPDVITQFLIGIPLYFLYEISILISARVAKKEAARNS